MHKKHSEVSDRYLKDLKSIVGRPITGSDAKTKPVNEVNTEKPKGLDG